MKNVSDLLRQADPLKEDLDRLDEARGRIRRAAVEAASAAPPRRSRPMHRPRLVLGAAALAVILVVFGFLVGFGDRGTVRAAVRFEVRLAETEPVPGLIVARSGHTERVLYLHPEQIVTNDDIAQSWVMPDGPDHFGISVVFLPDGARRMQQATASHIGRPVAILIDGEVVTAPVVRSPIGSSAVITGDYTQADADRIANGIGLR